MVTQSRLFLATLVVLWVGVSRVPAVDSQSNRPSSRAQPPRMFRELRSFSADEAHQAVAVDTEHFYAITNRSVAKYVKQSGEAICRWTAPADSSIRHINSGLVLDARLYCGHSNWPQEPLRNTIEMWDAKTLQHVGRREFPQTAGALTWVDRRDGSWWAVFAHYGAAEVVQRTTLIRFDDSWQPQTTWTFPREVIQRFAPYSNSGGSWGPDGLLYATGHDAAETYALRAPSGGGPLQLVDTLPAPIAGQGVAWDRTDLGLIYGIRRQTKEVVVMRLSHTEEFGPLHDSVTWQRHDHNPILPPGKSGTFDATRCMNPWVLREDDHYHLYYSGGDETGRQRICLATAPVTNSSNWTRQGPLFETGPTGSFDARWCVLPHVVRFAADRWHLYYTGNAGQGSGLSAFPGIGLAVSQDGRTWSKHANNPVLAPSGQPGDPDAMGIAGGSLVRVTDAQSATQWRFYYTGCPTIGSPLHLNQQKTICLAVSHDGISWKKRGAVMFRDPARDYEDIAVAGPVVQVADDGSFRMWYSAIGTRWGYYSICYAESADGIHWRRGQRYGDNLQLTPQGEGWEQQMVEYPSIVREGDRLRLFYCGNGYGRTGIGTAVSQP